MSRQTVSVESFMNSVFAASPAYTTEAEEIIAEGNLDETEKSVVEDESEDSAEFAEEAARLYGEARALSILLRTQETFVFALEEDEYEVEGEEKTEGEETPTEGEEKTAAEGEETPDEEKAEGDNKTEGEETPDEEKAEGDATGTESEGDPKSKGAIAKKIWTFLKAMFEKLKLGAINAWKSLTNLVNGDVKKIREWYGKLSAGDKAKAFTGEGSLKMKLPKTKNFKEFFTSKKKELDKSISTAALILGSVKSNKKLTAVSETGAITIDSIKESFYGSNATVEEVTAKKFGEYFGNILADIQVYTQAFDKYKEVIKTAGEGVTVCQKFINDNKGLTKTSSLGGAIKVTLTAAKEATKTAQKTLGDASTTLLWLQHATIGYIKSGYNLAKKSIGASADKAE